jgi:hypothetical protein
MNDALRYGHVFLVALSCAALAAPTARVHAEKTGAADQTADRTSDTAPHDHGQRRADDANRFGGKGHSRSKNQGDDGQQEGHDTRHTKRDHRPGYSGRHSRANFSPTVILGNGFPLPQPRLSSHGSYTVEDVPHRGDATSAHLLTSNALASHLLAGAEHEFRRRRYASALRLVRHAQLEEPQNRLLQAMAGQILFTTGDFQAAAHDLNDAASGLDRQRWNALVACYRVWHADGAEIVQLSHLGEYIGSHPEDGQARFLRGWQFALLEQPAAAAADLEVAISIDPQLAAATDLLMIIRGQHSPPFPTAPTPGGEQLPSPRPLGTSRNSDRD